MPLIEFEQGTGFPADNMTLATSLPQKTKLFVTWRGRLYRHTSDSEDFARSLREGVFAADCARSYEAFRELLHEHPAFTGRGGRNPPSVAPPRLPLDEPLRRALAAVAQAAEAADVQVRTAHILHAALTAEDGVALRLFAGVGDFKIAEENQELLMGLQNDTSMRGYAVPEWMDRDDFRKAVILASQANSPCVRSRHLLLAILLSNSGTSLQLRSRLGPDKYEGLVATTHAWPDHPPGPLTPGG